MGLDICVRKILSEPKDKDDYFRLIDDDGNYDRRGFPEWTKPFEREITEPWYDWETYKEQTGIDVFQCEWLGEYYGKKESILELWPNSAGKCPEVEDFKKEDGEIDFDKYNAVMEKYTIKVNLDKVPTFQKTIKVLYYEEVGYQRKGLNGNFYKDYEDGKIGYFVWTKSEIERYKESYCDEPYEYIYPNGEKSGTMIYPKDDFQKNIIDKFVEGEDCVIFDW